jgi:uncharacterized protein YwgA
MRRRRFKVELTFSNNLRAAYLTELVRSFEKFYPNGFLGRTAIQKLTYFARAIGVPIPCSFEIYNYGPYSDQVTFTVDGLLADEVFRDTSPNSSKYSNYRLAGARVVFPQELEKQVAPFGPQIAAVVKNLGNFRPEQLELIATLHFVHHRQAALGKRPTQSSVIAEFSRIKGDKFEKSEVTNWYGALRRAGLVEAASPFRAAV